MQFFHKLVKNNDILVKNMPAKHQLLFLISLYLVLFCQTRLLRTSLFEINMEVNKTCVIIQSDGLLNYVIIRCASHDLTLNRRSKNFLDTPSYIQYNPTQQSSTKTHNYEAHADAV